MIESEAGLCAEVVKTLDLAVELSLSGGGDRAVETLCDELRGLLLSVSTEIWLDEIVPLCRNHPIHQVLLQDPYTERAYSKPRGYAGDAVMLDYIYSGICPSGTTSAGRRVFSGTTRGSNGRSVLYRRDLLAQRIDEYLASGARSRVLSLACGHVREASRSDAVMSGAVEEYICLDQDSQSLEVASREAVSARMRFLKASVSDVVRDRVSLPQVSFAYAAGLFDYLPDELATRLLLKMFALLHSGGWLLIGNFCPGNNGQGYMEAFMDWRLLCRDEARVELLLGGLASDHIAARRLYRDPERNALYLELQKA